MTTKVPSELIANNAVGITQLNVSDGSAGQFLKTDGSGTLSFATVSGTTINNNADNRVITGSGTANTLEGEANFVFDGTHVGIGMTPAPVGSDTVLSIYNSATPRIKLHNSTTGTASGDGAEINMSSSDLIIENREAGNQRFFTNGSERLRIDAAGLVSIGNDDAGSMSANANKLVVGTGSGDQGMSVFAGTSTGRYAFARAVGDNTDAYDGGMAYDGSRNLTFHTNANAERMRIDGSGNVGIGSTSITNILELKKSTATAYDASAKQDGGARLSIFNSNNTLTDTFADIHFQCHSTSPGEARIGMELTSVANSDIFFVTEGSGTLSEKFRIMSTGSLIAPSMFGSTANNPAVKYNATSGLIYYDTSSIRYKENVQDLPNSLEKVKALRPVTFDEKSSGDSCTGLIAEEVVVEIPDLVQLIDVEGYDTPQPNSVDYAKLSVYLLKAIQEQQAQIDALQSEINNLKGE